MAMVLVTVHGTGKCYEVQPGGSVATWATSLCSLNESAIPVPISFFLAAAVVALELELPRGSKLHTLHVGSKQLHDEDTEWASTGNCSTKQVRQEGSKHPQSSMMHKRQKEGYCLHQ